jgi:protein TonB
MQVESKKYQRIAWIISIVLHVLLLVLFLFIGFEERDPPLEEIGMPLTIRLGFDEAGQGETFDQATPQEAVSTEAASTPTPQSTPNYATQDAQQTIAVKKDEKPKEEIQKPAQEIIQKPEEPKVNEHLNHLINKFKNNTNTGNGTQNGGGNDGVAGAQGRPDGSKTGGDIGGSFPGGGGSFLLKGRNMLSVPIIQDNSQDEGKVVVEILVDRKGNVIRATPGARGTTTNSPVLFKKAQEAAFKAKFTPNDQVAEEQTGTMTFIFKFQ